MKTSAALLVLGLVAYATAQSDCGCSADDIKIVLRDWESVWGAEFTGRRVAIAQEIFADLFANVPAARGLFKRVNVDNPNSPEFKAHCIRVVNGLDLALNLLNDPAALESALNHLSRQHGERDGVTASAFYEMHESFDRVLTRVIPGFNHDAWHSCYMKISDGISGGLPA